MKEALESTLLALVGAFVAAVIIGFGPEQMGDGHAPLNTHSSLPEARVVYEDTSRRTHVDGAHGALLSLWGPPDGLSLDSRRALLASRLAAETKLIETVGGGGEGAVQQVLELYSEANSLKEKLVLIRALGANPSTAACRALEEVASSESVFRLQEEALRALGTSISPEGSESLLRALHTVEDPRLAQVAVQGLFGDVGALGALEALAATDAPMKVRLEAVYSLGGIQTDDARSTLALLASDTSLEPRLRLFAEQALVRGGG